MRLPPFTWKSCLVYLVGVAAVLFLVYMLISALYHATPRKRINLQKSGGAAACSVGRAVSRACGPEVWVARGPRPVRDESSREMA